MALDRILMFFYKTSKKRNTGRYYRVKPDGSDLMPVYEQSNFESLGSMILFDNKVLILGNTYYVDEEGKVKYTNKDKAGNVQDCLWEATIQEDGTWSPLTRVPYVFEE